MDNSYLPMGEHQHSVYRTENGGEITRYPPNSESNSFTTGEHIYKSAEKSCY